MDTRDERWLLSCAAERSPDARARLFCIPYAGGGGSAFRHWAAALPGEIELVAVQLPGRENRIHEPLLSAMGDAAPAIADALTPLLDKPYAIFGHSTGALIGFEVIRELRRRRLSQPRLLIVSAQNAPAVKPAVIRHLLADAEFIEVLRACNGMPDVLLQDPALLDLVLPRIRADGALFETYQYEREAPLDCRIVVMHGTADRLVAHDGLARWAEETHHGVSHHPFPGDHFFIHTEEAAVLEHVNRELFPLLREAPSPMIG